MMRHYRWMYLVAAALLIAAAALIENKWVAILWGVCAGLQIGDFFAATARRR